MRAFIRAHRLAVVVACTAVAAGVVFVLVWFQPQALLVERTVSEPAPAASARPDGSPGVSAPAEHVVLGSGPFRSLAHPTSGVASLLRLPDGSLSVRISDFSTSSGPDVRVWLSTASASESGRAFAEDFVDLGALKGNRGDQTYSVPAGTGTAKFRSVVIWCRRFTVGFGVAPLTA